MEKEWLLPYWIREKKFGILEVYPYTNSVEAEIFEQISFGKSPFHDSLEKFGNSIKELLKEKGIEWEKIGVVKLVTIVDSGSVIIFVSFKNNLVKIGLSNSL